MPQLLSLFLYGFIVDAMLSLAAYWLPFSTLHILTACVVFSVALVLYTLCAFLPSLPKRLILPAFLFLLWADICGGFPLAFVAPEHRQILLGGTQIILACALLALHRHAGGLPQNERGFSWRGFTGMAALSVILLPIALVAMAMNSFGLYLEKSSGGYVKLRPGGLFLEEREMSKGSQRVRLVSMVHIGEKNFYDHILDSIPVHETAIVLVEGVTDDQGLLKSRFSYAKIAALLGLEPQEKSDFQHQARTAVLDENVRPATPAAVQYRRADVDISTFQPLTLAFLNAIGAILSDPTVETIVRTVSAPDSPFKEPHAEEVLMHDILDKRNDHLLAEIDEALHTSQTVIVPWGALHLSSIESSLKERGFRETARLDRPVIHFGSQQPTSPAP